MRVVRYGGFAGRPRLPAGRRDQSTDSAAEHYFYMTMSVRERWSVRELRRQIDAALFERYMSVKRDPEKCLPTNAESGDLMPFKDHYILEFLGLDDEHSEKQLRKAILDNLTIANFNHARETSRTRLYYHELFNSPTNDGTCQGFFLDRLCN